VFACVSIAATPANAPSGSLQVGVHVGYGCTIKVPADPNDVTPRATLGCVNRAGTAQPLIVTIPYESVADSKPSPSVLTHSVVVIHF
jgi:hypothetical protein